MFADCLQTAEESDLYGGSCKMRYCQAEHVQDDIYSLYPYITNMTVTDSEQSISRSKRTQTLVAGAQGFRATTVSTH